MKQFVTYAELLPGDLLVEMGPNRTLLFLSSDTSNLHVWVRKYLVVTPNGSRIKTFDGPLSDGNQKILYYQVFRDGEWINRSE